MPQNPFGPPPFRMMFSSDDASAQAESSSHSWEPADEEGQLSVDVLDAGNMITVTAPMAGAVSSRIEVYIQNDLLTIRGVRMRPAAGPDKGGTPVHQECFWGKFSRSIVLPVHVKADLARAEYRNGILSIRVPKRQSDAQIPVTIVDE